MTGFEGIGDFDSSDPYQRYIAHQAAKGNYPRFSHDDEIRLICTPRPDDGPFTRELKRI